MDEYAAAPEEDFSGLSIADRLAHKNWKARVNGYEFLIKGFAATGDESDPIFQPYLYDPEVLKKMVLDSSAVAQEKALDAVINFVKFGGEPAARTRHSVVPALVEKCLGSARVGTKQKAISLVLDYIEVENSSEGVIDVLPGLAAKQPKTVAATAAAIKEAITAFGLKLFNAKSIVAILPKIFGHSDKNVRAEGTGIVLTMYRWVGAPLLAQLTELKPVQVKELTEACEAADKAGSGHGTGQPQRFTRVQQREREAAAAALESAAVDENPSEEPETFDISMPVEAVDIVPKIPPDFFTQISSSKWKDRKETLDSVLEVVKATPKIVDADGLGDLVKALAGRMPDTNINVVMTAASIIGLLAKGVGPSFARFKTTTIPPMLDRLKERKQSVVDALGEGLDGVFGTIPFPDLTEEFITYLKHKNPQVREGTVKFLNRCLSTTRIPPEKSGLKAFADSLVELMNDSAESIRSGAQEGLALLMKIFGERAMNPFLDPVDDIKKGKVKEAFEKATVKCKAGAAAPVPAAPKPAAPPSKKAPVKASAPPVPSPSADSIPPTPPPKDDLFEEVKPPKAKPPARFLAKKAAPSDSTDAAPAAGPSSAPKPPPSAAAPKKLPPAAAAAMAKVTKTSNASAPAATASTAFKYKFTPEDAEGRIAELIPQNFAAELGDSAWKVRLATLEESFPQWLDDAIDTVEAELIFRFLGKKPGWNEKNFQVSAKVYGIMASIAERSPSFSKSCIVLSAPHLTDKLGDIKLKKPATDTLLVFAEKTSLAFIFEHCFEPISKQKAPKNYAEGVAFVNNALKEFGIAGLSLKSVIEFLKQALGHSNPTVKSSATATLVTLRLFAGPAIRDLLNEGLSSQLLATIDAEFAKADGQEAPTPTRVSADVQAVAASGGSKSKGGADPMDDLFPRQDLEKIVEKTKIIEEANDASFKTRKEALETLQTLLGLSANKRLKPNLVNIASMLKPRLVDSNKAVQAAALDIVAKIATGMNKPFEKQCRILIPPIMQAMTDRAAPVRAACAATLTAVATACEGVDAMVVPIAAGLTLANPISRGAILGWLESWNQTNTIPSTTELSAWVAPLILCLDDKSGEVRKGALAIVPTVIASVGFDKVVDGASALKPASRSGVIAQLQSAKGLADALAPAPAAAAPSAPPKARSAPAAPEPIAPPSSTPSEASEPATAAAPRKVGMLARRPIAPATSRPASRAESPAPSVQATPARTRLQTLKRPLPGASKIAAIPPLAESSASGCPFLGSMTEDAKRARLIKDSNKWIVETGPARKDLLDLLQVQMEGHVTRDVLQMLFSNDHNAVNDHISGLTVVAETFAAASRGEGSGPFGPEDLRDILIANLDLPMKYVSMKVHEPQPNLVNKCLDLVENTIQFLIASSHVMTDAEALCFVPTIIHKLGDAREPVRAKVQSMIQDLPKAFSFSRLFTLLMEQGLLSKVNKTRQGALDEMALLIKKKGMAACDPPKAFPIIAAMVGDKDPAARKSALSVIGEAYVLEGEKVWSFMGKLDPKLQTQVEERLRRMPGPSRTASSFEAPSPNPVSRLTSALPRPASPAGSIRRGPLNGLASPTSIGRGVRPSTPPMSSLAAVNQPPPSPPRGSQVPSTPASRLRPMQSRLALPKSRQAPVPAPALVDLEEEIRAPRSNSPPIHPQSSTNIDRPYDDLLDNSMEQDEISIIISSILSGDPSRSVDALKKLQKTLDIPPEAESSSFEFQNLSNHTDGLIETIVLQMSHVWERNVSDADNYRLAKHLIQTLNTFCEHPVLAESLPVEILTSLFEELTARLLQSDDSADPKIKDLSKFINMIILKLFDTARRINVFRALLDLLNQITKPFATKRTAGNSREARLAELVLKCLWKLARAIPANLRDESLDPVELFPALERFLQSIPPNEWRARAQAKVPCGDMPLRTIKVIIQHVVGAFGDDVYDYLSKAFEDPSATIVYPYVYRTLNNVPAQAPRPASMASYSASANMEEETPTTTPTSPPPSQRSPSIVSSIGRPPSDIQSQRLRSGSTDVHPHDNGTQSAEEEDVDARLNVILGHISSETTGSMHKEGITQLYHFLKEHPEKQSKVDRMLDSTGPQFRKYLARALASRANEDPELQASRDQSLARLEANSGTSTPASPRSPRSPTSSMSPARRSTVLSMDGSDANRLSKLHDLFHYQGRSSIVGDSRRASMSSTSNGITSNGNSHETASQHYAD
ncbi:ARM repeat-containing protein [Clavulina sp. PMI_390]|nr:ARM repeat-containing protein [Clavulina sp. PMI_390]